MTGVQTCALPICERKHQQNARIGWLLVVSLTGLCSLLQVKNTTPDEKLQSKGRSTWKITPPRTAQALDLGLCTAKITDFGLSLRIDNGQTHVSNINQGEYSFLIENIWCWYLGWCFLVLVKCLNSYTQLYPRKPCLWTFPHCKCVTYQDTSSHFEFTTSKHRERCVLFMEWMLFLLCVFLPREVEHEGRNSVVRKQWYSARIKHK